MEEPFGLALSGRKYSIKEVKKLIDNSTNDLFINVSYYLDVYSDGKLNAPAVLQSLGVIKWDNSRYLGNNTGSDKFKSRFLFLVRKIAGAVLMGRVNKLSSLSDILISALLTPMTDFNVGVAILDGSAVHNSQPLFGLYGDDYLKVHKPMTRPEECRIKVRVVNAPFSKISIMNLCEAESVNLYKKYLDTLVSLGKRYGGTRYFVSYKDKDRQAKSSTVKISSGSAISSEQTISTLINDRIEFVGEVEKILKNTNESYISLSKGLRDFGVGENDLVDWYLSYYGLTKGSNSLNFCDTVIL